MGTKVKGIYKGILVLLALCSTAYARDTSNQIFPKQPIVLLVSVTDGVAFTTADTESLRRYVKNKLPNHDFIHVNASIDFEFSKPPTLEFKKAIQEKLAADIRAQVLPNYEITHLILMDHGNITSEWNAKTLFKFLGVFGKSEILPEFDTIFNPLIGKFSDNALIMMESCLTVCDGVIESQARIETLMKYFKIRNGRVFGAYQTMVSVGYEMGFHLQQITGRMKSVPIFTTAFIIGLVTQIDSLIYGTPFDFLTFFAVAIGTDVAIPVMLKALSYLRDRMEIVNWGYLYQFNGGKIEKIFQLNPYQNLQQIYLKLKPKKFKKEIYTCSFLFS